MDDLLALERKSLSLRAVTLGSVDRALLCGFLLAGDAPCCLYVFMLPQLRRKVYCLAMPCYRTQSLPEPLRSARRYSLGFSAASLRPELARIVADAYLACGDWATSKQRVLSENALQARTAASAVRMEREIRQWVQLLTAQQIDILAKAPADSRAAVAWLSMLKHSAFVFEFAAEVLRAKLQKLDTVLRPSDYESVKAMYGNQAAFH